MLPHRLFWLSTQATGPASLGYNSYLDLALWNATRGANIAIDSVMRVRQWAHIAHHRAQSKAVSNTGGLRAQERRGCSCFGIRCRAQDLERLFNASVAEAIDQLYDNDPVVRLAIMIAYLH